MKLSDRARNFSIMAHEGQFRRSYKDIPYVVHSLTVGLILKTYGFSEAVEAAGYLHDVPEETKITIDDIAKMFGPKVASIVMTAIEPDSSLSWKERKKNQIKVISNLPVDNMALICADKIANLEEFRMQFKRKGYADFSLFHAGKEDQEWFFRSVYEEAIKVLGNPMVDPLKRKIVNRFKTAIEDVFEKDTFYTYAEGFDSDVDFQALGVISGYQEDLQRLKTIIGEQKPYIVEFAGNTNSGNKSIVSSFKKFLEGANFRVRVVEDYNAKNRFEKALLNNPASISTVEKHLLISSAIEEDLMRQIVGDQDIIMVDSGLYDVLLYIKFLKARGVVSEADLKMFLLHYMEEIESLVNHVIICYSKSMEAEFGEIEDILPNHIKVSEAAINAEKLITGTSVVDTTKLDTRAATLMVADTLLPIMRRDYVLELKKYLDQNRAVN